MDIETYNKKRDFSKTSEPKGKISRKEGRRFVIQEHFASRHHFDFRLELGGALKSWAVPKGPSLNPKDKRLAVHVEDHPLEYGNFEGIIPKGEYGGGKVVLWDQGEWITDKNPMEGYKKGKLEFELKGKKLHGRWALVKTKLGPESRQENWLLMKKNDQYANAGSDIVRDRPESVKATKEKVGKLDINAQLATLNSKVPEGDNYIHEVKLDGYRTLAKLQNGQARLFTRNMKDWTDRYPLIARALMTEKYNSALVDGEIVWVDENGRPSFEGLQNALKTGSDGRMRFYVFDVLEINGDSVKELPQEIRKGLVQRFVDDMGEESILYSEHFTGAGNEVLAKCCEMGLEGVISKDASAPYQEGRNSNWRKIKCENRDEFAILGYLPRKDAVNEIGALILGLWKKGGFVEVGKVGTGFNKSQRKELYSKLEPLKSQTPLAAVKLKDKNIVWVEPKLVAQIKYAEITSSQKLRHPVYIELREDKEPEQAYYPKDAPARYAKEELLQLITSP
ncbi:MAG: non-homologous end-joining DNA ligase, partial [Bacteriovoracaceae bacterium]